MDDRQRWPVIPARREANEMSPEIFFPFGQVAVSRPLKEGDRLYMVQYPHRVEKAELTGQGGQGDLNLWSRAPEMRKF